MAASGKPPGSSRWGNFLSVVESKLDTILADAEDAPADNAAATALDKKQTGGANGKGTGNGLSRTGSNASRTNDRLQERLAKAVAQKNAAQKANSSNVTSRTASPSRSIATSSPRQSLDTRPVRTSVDVIEDKEEELDSMAKNADEEKEADQGSEAGQNLGNGTSVGMSPESSDSPLPRPSTDSTRPALVEEAQSPTNSIDQSSDAKSSSLLTPAEYEKQIQQLKLDYETAELQRQEEVHNYIEQIDGLQAKLQYLSKEAIESAKKAASEAPAGSAEKKLAEKEEQIMLLMEEGQKLSKTELKNMNTIKKLYAKIAESNKEVEEAQKKTAKTEKEVSRLTDRVRKSELAEKNLNERVKSMTRLQKEIETIRAERDSKDSMIADLKAQLERSQAETKQAREQINHEALQAEKKRVLELEEELCSIKIEKDLAADRAQARVKELQEQGERDSERARVAEMEMKAEQQMLESKLEVIRARAEEVSSGATGDAQAKLLRQVETLQSQYSIASENWKGIEASLVSRMTILEKERDETARREADVRRKAREVTMKSKRNEEELEDTKSRLDTLQHDLVGHKTALDKLQTRAEDAETALRDAKKAFEQEKQAWRAEKEQQTEDEKSGWRGDLSGNASFNQSRAESPANTHLNGGQRGLLTSEFLGLQEMQIRRASARSMNGAGISEVLPTPERLIGRRSSAQPPILRNISSRQGTPKRQGSVQSFESSNLERGPGDRDVLDTPSIHTPSMDQDNDDLVDYLRGATHSSPQQTINDMVSASTVGAGPSVQLVERMSAAVRRLESEKVATQEEMARLVMQRDEARKEIASLMQEVETKRGSDKRVKVLEGQVVELEDKLGTTLEMLGEKSEREEELQADVADLKVMYRELVERTVK